MSIAANKIPEGTILVSRPLWEAVSYFRALETPSLSLLIRLVKTCALAIFRWHFYDTDTVLVAGCANYFHSLQGKLVAEEPGKIQNKYPFILENAALFVPTAEHLRGKLKFADFKPLAPLTLSKVITHFQTYPEAGFVEIKGTVSDLWKNPFFEYKSVSN